MLLGFSWPSAALLAALISSHTLIAYPALLRLGLHKQVPVVTAVGGTLITDTLALATLAIVLSVSAPEATILRSLLPLALLGALVALAFAAVPRLSRRFFRREGTSAAEHALFALAVLLILSAATELTGTDRILGAFLAGITLNRPLAERPRLREHIEFVGRMLFIPFFFIWTGTLLDLDVLTGEARVWLLAALLVALVVFGKSVAAWIVGAVHGYDRRSRVLMAGLTLPQAAATLAIAITALQDGLFDAELIDAVIILILVTCVIGPIVAVRIGQGMRRGLERESGDEPVHPQLDEPRDV